MSERAVILERDLDCYTVEVIQKVSCGACSPESRRNCISSGEGMARVFKVAPTFKAAVGDVIEYDIAMHHYLLLVLFVFVIPVAGVLIGILAASESPLMSAVMGGVGLVLSAALSRFLAIKFNFKVTVVQVLKLVPKDKVLPDPCEK